jgi:hypothetical protein
MLTGFDRADDLFCRVSLLGCLASFYMAQVLELNLDSFSGARSREQCRRGLSNPIIRSELGGSTPDVGNTWLDFRIC